MSQNDVAGLLQNDYVVAFDYVGLWRPFKEKTNREIKKARTQYHPLNIRGFQYVFSKATPNIFKNQYQF